MQQPMAAPALTEEERYHVWTEHVRAVFGGGGYRSSAYALLADTRPNESAYERLPFSTWHTQQALRTSDAAMSHDGRPHDDPSIDGGTHGEAQRERFADEHLFPHCFYTRMVRCTANRPPYTSSAAERRGAEGHCVDDDEALSSLGRVRAATAEEQAMRALAARLRTRRAAHTRTQAAGAAADYPPSRRHMYSETLPFMDARVEAQQAQLYEEMCTLLLDLKEGNKMRDEVRRCLERSKALRQRYAQQAPVEEEAGGQRGSENSLTAAAQASPDALEEVYESDFEESDVDWHT
ncbi:hypothetical protein STCU_11421 [Strigomonas culicis]|uniref:Uncharacterized protein n=1 Tax=Strigomonas culicis TaxID=28005 RepID=S9TE24_9TRYP|nr:hypothetical protein STCU_11421 [Strigomonas culicis]|eukprot:EPY16292.1 hypothetical protein STCU_11421 [Strigomonas culicis]